ncbi:MAG: CinA family protein, partial [Candidatus Bipolaricaulota bacterium]
MREIEVGKLLAQRGETLAVAESCTGGLLAGRITDVPGASAHFLGGIIAYSNEIKAMLL